MTTNDGLTPITISTSQQANCPLHGEMQQNSSLIRRYPDEHIHALKDGYTLWTCPECCIELRRDIPFQTPPNAPLDDPDEASMWVLFLFVHTKWEQFNDPFVDLGKGEFANEDGAIGYATGDGTQLTVETDKEGRQTGKWEDDVDLDDAKVFYLENPPTTEQIPSWLFEDAEDDKLGIKLRGPDGVIRPSE